MARPLTRVYLLSTPLENDYQNTIYFSNREQQSAYFSSCVKHYFDDFSYQRKDHTMRIPKHYDDIQNCNYVMYENQTPKGDNKWYYAFIKEMKYVNDERTDLIIETDVLQTWMFDYEVKASFVEREHTDNDVAGYHTLDEGVAYGEYIINAHTTPVSRKKDDLCYVLGTTVNPNDGNDLNGGNVYNGIYSGMKYYRYDDIASLDTALARIDKESKQNGAICLFLAPKDVAVSDNLSTNHEVNQNYHPRYDNIDMSMNEVLDGYTPRNKKLLCYPYNFLRVSNNAGQNAIYQYELFGGTSFRFKLYETLTPSISGRLIPLNYKGSAENLDEGLTEGKYPICNWTSDMYTNWQTQNAVNQTFDFVMGVGSTVMGAAALVAGGATGVGALAGGVFGGGLMTSGITQIVNTLNNDRKASLMPDQVHGNINAGDVNTSMGQNTFHFYQMSVKKEFAEILDSYFDMYGYKCNKVKVPNKHHRRHFWYTKTIDVNIASECIPQNDLNIIKHCYDNGITFWNDWEHIRDYSEEYCRDNTTDLVE